MANIRLPDSVANAMLDAINTKMNAGSGAATIKIYSGTQPATGGGGLSGNTLLATLTATDPAAPGASSRTLTFSTITQDASADASALATWARIADSDGTTVFDCDVGEGGGGASLTLNESTIAAGGPVSISSLTISYP